MWVWSAAKGLEMVHKPLLIVTARKLLYLIRTMNEAIVLRPPKTLAEAKVMLDTFEVICSEGIREAEEELGPFAAAA
jgi:hypothetical protein